MNAIICRGGVLISRGGVLYRDYVTQHTPFSYYLCAIFSLLGAKSVEQFRLLYYFFTSFIYGFAYYRYSDIIGKKKMLVLPIAEVVVTTAVIKEYGMQLLSDNIQGLFTVLLLMEFYIYCRDMDISCKRCIIVSMCIWGSVGAAFVSVFSLVWIIIGFVINEFIFLYRNGREINRRFSDYFRLVIAMIVPGILGGTYFFVNRSLKEMYDQCYLFNREVYTRYGAEGESIIQPFLNSARYFFELIADNFLSIVNRETNVTIIVQLIVVMMVLYIILNMVLQKRYLEAIVPLLTMMGAASRGYDFHGAAAWNVAIMIVVLLGDYYADCKFINKKAMLVIVCVVPLVVCTYVSKVANNLLTKQSSISELEYRTTKLLDEESELFIDCCVNDLLYYYYKGKAPVNRVVYILPWYMDWYEDRCITDLYSKKPTIVVYNAENEVWGHSYFANSFYNVLQSNYVRLSDNQEDGLNTKIWRLNGENE